jgi:putative PIN family toxin of toxin-antitoxin system
VTYDKIGGIIRDILSHSQLIIPRQVIVKKLRDFKDTKIIACALSAKADYIVTGDKDLLVLKHYHKIPILTPKAFLELLK